MPLHTNILNKKNDNIHTYVIRTGTLQHNFFMFRENSSHNLSISVIVSLEKGVGTVTNLKYRNNYNIFFTIILYDDSYNSRNGNCSRYQLSIVDCTDAIEVRLSSIIDL